MGQQQLLLIVLSIVVVGLAIIVAINVFLSSSVQTNRDALIHDLYNLAFRADEYFKKPGYFEGGGNSFIGFQIPIEMKSNNNGSYTIKNIVATQLTIEGVGIEIGINQTEPIKYTALIGQYGIISLTQQN